MDNGSDKPTFEIFCGLPVIMRPLHPDRPVIRIKPKKPRKKKRVQNPMSIGHQERKDLTMKMRKALSGHFSGMTKKAAGIAAGYTPDSAGIVVNNALRLVAGNAAFLEEMEKQGITNEHIVEKIKDGMEAEHPLAKKDPDTGEVRKDWHAIDKFVDKAMKVKDVFPATRIKSESENKHIHIHITADGMEGIDKYERMRREAIDGSPDPY